VTLRRWWIALPSTATSSEAAFANGQRWDRLREGDAALSVAVKADWPLSVSLLATGNSALGRGARGAVPLHLVYESRDLALTEKQSAHWRLTMRVEGKAEGKVRGQTNDGRRTIDQARGF
jgi:hypothetical protein